MASEDRCPRMPVSNGRGKTPKQIGQHHRNGNLAIILGKDPGTAEGILGEEPTGCLPEQDIA